MVLAGTFWATIATPSVVPSLSTSAMPADLLFLYREGGVQVDLRHHLALVADVVVVGGRQVGAVGVVDDALAAGATGVDAAVCFLE